MKKTSKTLITITDSHREMLKQIMTEEGYESISAIIAYLIVTEYKRRKNIKPLSLIE